MHLGLATLTLMMPQNGSLKEKRRVVQGVKDRLRHRLGVSVAEVADQDQWRSAVLAVACVGSDRSVVERVLQQAYQLAEGRGDAEVWDFHIEWR